MGIIVEFVVFIFRSCLDTKGVRNWFLFWSLFLSAPGPCLRQTSFRISTEVHGLRGALSIIGGVILGPQGITLVVSSCVPVKLDSWHKS